MYLSHGWMLNCNCKIVCVWRVTWWVFYHGLMVYIKLNIIYIELMHSRRGFCVDHNFLLYIICISHTFLDVLLCWLWYCTASCYSVGLKTQLVAFFVGVFFPRFSRGTTNVRQNQLAEQQIHYVFLSLI